jgi:hypothetical protein
MMSISLAGLLGAIAGTALAALSYYSLVGALDRGMQERRQSQSPEERESFERNMSIVRRAILIIDLIVFAGLGYWIGSTVWD